MIGNCNLLKKMIKLNRIVRININEVKSEIKTIANTRN